VTSADDGAPRAKPPNRSLAGGGRIVRNVGLNIGGQVFSIVIAIATVPILVHALGTSRFGVLSLAYVTVGYSGVLDLGLGRALTKLTSERLARDDEGAIPDLFWTAMKIMAIAGVIGGLILVAITPLLVDHVLNVPSSLQAETRTAFRILALAVPVSIMSSAARGFLEAHQRFDYTNLVSVCLAGLTYGAPAIAVQFDPHLPIVMALIVLSRSITLAAFMAFSVRVEPALRRMRKISRRAASPLMRFGGWLTANNLLGPVLVDMDRYVIAAMLSASAVTYYVTPDDATSKLFIISFGIVGVLFPAFAYNAAIDGGRAVRLFGQGSRVIFAAMFPVVLIGTLFASELLDLWLGSTFADRSTRVLQWMLANALVTSMAQVTFGLVQNLRPDFSAKLLLVEVPTFIGLLILLTNSHGIEGAAMAGFTRDWLNSLALYAFAMHLLPMARPVVARLFSLQVAALVVLALASQAPSVAVKLVAAAVALPVFGALAWRRVLDAPERELVVRAARRVRRRRLADVAG
jgi:O-antigen/teichoic acid export membrane protein